MAADAPVTLKARMPAAPNRGGSKILHRISPQFLVWCAAQTSRCALCFYCRRNKSARPSRQSALILCACATILPRTSTGKEPYGEGRDARISGGGDGTAPQCHVQGEARERTRDHRPYGGANAQEPHQGACRRQGSGRDDAL